ncbi:DNA sulfur modification protein DndB [Mesorhizobium sp. CO1-1-8]|uniref:DNA sulfur modification protein DndB n=1 Tax=Mesorhizobium sp. CO1-1-8 TaxID=2876631 RepID=UPI001CD0B65C|nr:DNA sulfur modification protein DndB [Mesorhizobium sp. CO1-1-8]MBZ9774022.1 hypothetical protein [Mesorhizobium sp. CO1-1-8]
MSFVINSAVPEALTPELLFIKGSVSLWNYSIPFFTTNVPLNFAEKYFKLFEELPQADTGEWTLEELFQRDISWERVDNEILAYLNSPTRPQFFNSLTVALMPSHTQSLGGDFGPPIDIPPLVDAGLGKSIGLGGVQIQFYGSDVDVPSGAGKLRWATDRVDAVAVDGQHRLAAIKRFVKEAKRERWEGAAVPIIFLIADERIGFRTPLAENDPSRTVSALRNVFIDLNKNARPVSPSRTILLDDLSIVSVSTRTLIGRSLGDTADEDRVPLSLVDWMTDRNKIDDGPFLTTVTLLHEAVRQLLAVPDLQLDEDDNSVKNVEVWLDAILPITDAAAREEILSQVRTCARLQTRLSWMPEQIKILQQSFEATWRPQLRGLLRNYKPYSDIWDYAEKHKLLGPQFVNLYVAQEAMPAKSGQERKKRLVEAAMQQTDGWTLAKRYEAPLAEIEEQKANNWAFKVVFQRALFRAFVNVIRNPKSYSPKLEGRGDAAGLFIACMNRLNRAKLDLVDAALKKEAFWAGSGLSADSTIEFTNAGAERIRAWLEIAFIIHVHGTAAPTFDGIEAWAAGVPAKTLSYLMDARRPAYKGMVKLAVARGLDGESDKPERYLKVRYEHLRSILREA